MAVSLKFAFVLVGLGLAMTIVARAFEDGAASPFSWFKTIGLVLVGFAVALQWYQVRKAAHGTPMQVSLDMLGIHLLVLAICALNAL